MKCALLGTVLLSVAAYGQTECLNLVSEYEVPDLQFADVHVRGTIAHVGAWGEYVSLDVSDPANPALVDRIVLPASDQHGPRDLLYNRVRAVGDIVVVGAEAVGGIVGGLNVLRIDGQGQVLDRLTFDVGVSSVAGVHSIEAIEERVFLLVSGSLVTISRDQLLSLFTAIPNRLTRPLSDLFLTGAETIETNGYDYDLALIGSDVFVGGDETGGGASVRRVAVGGAEVIMPGSVFSLGAGPSGTLLANRLGINRFFVFDAASPDVPLYEGPLSQEIAQMESIGPLMVAAAGTRGLQIYDMTNTSQPAEVADAGEFIRRAKPEGSLIYAIENAADFKGLLVFDASACVNAVLPCPGDIADDFGTIGADGMVSFGDFLALLGLVGPCPGMTPGCDGDIADDFGILNGGDGMVSFGDFLSLLGLVGPCP